MKKYKNIISAIVIVAVLIVGVVAYNNFSEPKAPVNETDWELIHTYNQYNPDGFENVSEGDTRQSVDESLQQTGTLVGTSSLGYDTYTYVGKNNATLYMYYEDDILKEIGYTV